MSPYVTLLPGAFNDAGQNTEGRTVKVEGIIVEGGEVWFEFTWAENEHDLESVHAAFTRTSTFKEIVQARKDYQYGGARFL